MSNANLSLTETSKKNNYQYDSIAIIYIEHLMNKNPIRATLNSLQKNGIDVCFVANKQHTLSKTVTLLDNHKTIGLGSSVIVEEIGIVRFLKNQQYIQFLINKGQVEHLKRILSEEKNES